MQPLTFAGKLFYGLGIAGIGLLQFIYPGFRPVVLPIPVEATQHLNFLVYLTGAMIVAAGLAIALLKNVKYIALFLGFFLLLFVIFGHLPNRLMNNPGSLGAWTNALKLLALSGGAFMVSTIYNGKNNKTALDKFALCGKYFFALLLVIFGIDHFLYTDFVKTLVPTWIPGPLFWTYFAGIALIGSGVALFINFKPKSIGILLALMLLIWLIILHIPRASIAPATDNGNELTSVFQAFAFSGMALMSFRDKRK